MSGDIQARLYAWCDRAAADNANRSKLTELVLLHLNASDQLQEIARFAIADPSDLSETKQELFKTAAEVVSAWRHFQRFAVQAYYGAEKPQSYYPFSLADETPDVMGQATEPANAVGSLKMQMRHNEVLAKINAGIQAEQTGTLLSLNKMLAEQLNDARKAYSELLQKTEGTILQREREQLERLQLERGEARKDQLASSATRTLPYIVNRMSEHLGGPKLLPETAGTPLEQLLASMFSGLNDNTFQQLLSCFPDPAHQAAILELYTKLVARPQQQAQGAPKH